MKTDKIRLIALLFVLLICCSKPDSAYQLIDLQKLDDSIAIDLRYATADNFLGRAVYSDTRCFLRRCTAERLVRVQKRLQPMGYGIKVWDGYRPLFVQKQMWEILPDAKYVANPATGSRHNRGAAVDVTLVDAQGNELEMPTPFDDFSEKAAAHYEDVSEAALKHRQILQSAMTAEGFQIYHAEWWHFNDPEWEKCEILDVDTKNL
ncbi:D-alanyl-D-alanine dipeptidase [candidate division KSB1 bacterium]|nr:D-alanyl-D-alanine dipeptidase [candidate division KSB1 bacterium]